MWNISRHWRLEHDFKGLGRCYKRHQITMGKFCWYLVRWNVWSPAALNIIKTLWECGEVSTSQFALPSTSAVWKSMQRRGNMCAQDAAVVSGLKAKWSNQTNYTLIYFLCRKHQFKSLQLWMFGDVLVPVAYQPFWHTCVRCLSAVSKLRMV